MARRSILGALVSVALVAAAGCDGAETEDVETTSSALASYSVDSFIRGYSGVATSSGGTSGSPVEYRAATYRTTPNGTSGNLAYRVGTTTLSGDGIYLNTNLAPGSAPWGYKRADGQSVILYIDTNRHVHEIGPAGNIDYTASPIFSPLAVAAPANGPVPDVIGYVRSDGRSAVIYRGGNNRVIQILSSSGGGSPWTVSDLTSMSGATVTANKGSAFPYVRADGYNTIIYRGSDNRIHELANLGSWYGDADLSAQTSDTLPAFTDPWGYARSDGYNCIVYIANDARMHELSLLSGGYWQSGIIPTASPSGGLFMRPSAYVRADGINAVVYVGSDARVHEVALVSGGWSDSPISNPGIAVASQAFGHRAPGNRSSVLFRGTNQGVIHGYELLLPTGGTWSQQEF